MKVDKGSGDSSGQELSGVNARLHQESQLMIEEPRHLKETQADGSIFLQKYQLGAQNEPSVNELPDEFIPGRHKLDDIEILSRTTSKQSTVRRRTMARIDEEDEDNIQHRLSKQTRSTALKIPRDLNHL